MVGRSDLDRGEGVLGVNVSGWRVRMTVPVRLMRLKSPVSVLYASCLSLTVSAIQID